MVFSFRGRTARVAWLVQGFVLFFICSGSEHWGSIGVFLFFSFYSFCFFSLYGQQRGFFFLVLSQKQHWKGGKVQGRGEPRMDHSFFSLSLTNAHDGCVGWIGSTFCVGRKKNSSGHDDDQKNESINSLLSFLGPGLHLPTYLSTNPFCAASDSIQLIRVRE